MPRSLSTALQNQVSAEATTTAFLIELNLSSVIRLTDHHVNVTYNSEAYEAGGSFLSVDNTTETGQLQVDELLIGFSNVTDQVRSLIQDGSFTDKVVEVNLAYFDAAGAIVGAISYFTGQIQSVSIDESINNSVISLSVASHWANWNLAKGLYYTDESQQAFSTGDKGLEFATQAKSNVRWGS